MGISRVMIIEPAYLQYPGSVQKSLGLTYDRFNIKSIIHHGQLSSAGKVARDKNIEIHRHSFSTLEKIVYDANMVLLISKAHPLDLVQREHISTAHILRAATKKFSFIHWIQDAQRPRVAIEVQMHKFTQLTLGD